MPRPVPRCCVNGIHDHVVLRAFFGKVFDVVINDSVGPDIANQISVRCTANARHLGPKVLGNLHASRTNRSGRPVDQDPFTCTQFPFVDQEIICGRGPERDGCCLLKGQVFWFADDHTVRWHRDVFRMRAKSCAWKTDDGIPGLESGHICTDSFDYPG